jgi:hypothetical protein
LGHKELRELRGRALHFTLDLSFAVSATASQSVLQPGKGLLRDQLVDYSKSNQVPGIPAEEIAGVLEAYLAKLEAEHEAS